MRDAACTAVPHLCAGAAPGLRTLISEDGRNFSCALVPPGASSVGLTLAFMEGFGVRNPPIKGGVELGILGHESAYALLCARHWVSQAPGCIPQWHCGLGRSLSDGNHCSGRHHLLVCKNIW